MKYIANMNTYLSNLVVFYLKLLDIPVEVMELQVEDNQVGQISVHISNIFQSIILLEVNFQQISELFACPVLYGLILTEGEKEFRDVVTKIRMILKYRCEKNYTD